MSNNYSKILAALIFTVLAGYMAVHKVDWSAFAAAFEKLDVFIWLLSLVFFIMANVFRAVRWQIIVSPGVKLGLKTFFPLIMIGRAVNDLVPTGVGEFYRSYLISKSSKLSYTSSIASILVERVFDGIVLVCFWLGLLWIVEVDNDIVTGIRAAALAIFLTAALMLILIIAFPDKFQSLAKPLLKKLPKRISSLITEGLKDFLIGLQFMKAPGIFWGTTLFSLVVWCFEILFYYSVFVAFGIEPQIWWAVLTIAVASMMIFIPSAPGYIGIYHWAIVLSLGFCGISESQALAVGVVMNISDMGLTLLLGLGFLFKMGFKFPNRELINKHPFDITEEKNV